MHRARTPMITIMGLALLSTLALMPRHMGHAAPLAPTVSGDTRWPLHEIQGRLADLQLAYHRRDASTYRTNVQALLGEARRADAAQITARLEVLIDIGRISGYDGFEPLILAYVDLLAKHVNGTGNSPPIATLSELQRGPSGLRRPWQQISACRSGCLIVRKYAQCVGKHCGSWWVCCPGCLCRNSSG
jgi:hypothetical protein